MGLVALVLLACQPAEESPSTDRSVADTSVDDTSSAALFVVGEPVVGVPEDAVARLVGEVRLSTSVPSRATLWIDGPCGRDEVPFPEATDHVLPVVGLHMAAEHQLTVVLEGAGERLEVDLGSLTTALIDDLPPFEVHHHDPELREPGLLVFAPYHDDDAGWVLAVDEALHVVYAIPEKVEDLTLLPDGTWLATHEDRVVQWDRLGRELVRWSDGEKNRLHHEAFPLDDGGFLTITGEVVVEPDYPENAEFTETGEHSLLAQQVLRFDGAGDIVERIRLAELLDTTHIGYQSLLGADPKDWAHVNSVVPWDDDSYVISVRHLDVIVCANRDGTLRWLLGDPAGWAAPWAEAFLTPTDPSLTWFRHPHALEVHADGLLVMFDNGNHGGSPYAPADDDVRRSRGLALRIDEEDGSFDQVWELPHEGLFSPGQGDADVLSETGNVMMVYSMVGVLPLRSRLVEMHPDRPLEPVLDVSIGGDRRRFIYRAEVVPTLYPELR